LGSSVEETPETGIFRNNFAEEEKEVKIFDP